MSVNQGRVAAWMKHVFTFVEMTDAPERALRLVEEAVEYAQACGVERSTVHRLVDYVYGRAMGDPAKEIAGVMMTLYAAAESIGVDADAEFERELKRVYLPEVIARVRRRQHEKRAALAQEWARVEHVPGR